MTESFEGGVERSFAAETAGRGFSPSLSRRVNTNKRRVAKVRK